MKQQQNQRDPSRQPAQLARDDDEGAAQCLAGVRLPDLSLSSTASGRIVLSRLAARTVLYVYPMTRRPDAPLPEEWDLIPGAGGCTAEACAFRDHHADLRSAGVDVFGLSCQTTADQQEAVARLHLPFPLLSDDRLELASALQLPTFSIHGQRLFKRLTLVVHAGVVEHVFYPVFSPDWHAEQVLSWLREHPRR